MLKSLVLAAAAIAPALVKADVCSATNNVLVFAWTIKLGGFGNGCCLDFQGTMQDEGGCAAVTNFKCAVPEGSGTTIMFKQSDFCSGRSIADAVRRTFGVDLDCLGQGPAG